MWEKVTRKCAKIVGGNFCLCQRLMSNLPTGPIQSAVVVDCIYMKYFLNKFVYATETDGLRVQFGFRVKYRFW